jgi:hypothetical protein
MHVTGVTLQPSAGPALEPPQTEAPQVVETAAVGRYRQLVSRGGKLADR